jgi:hypothetical protein
MKVAIAVLIVLCPAFASAQKFDIKIIDRQDRETEYTYVVPGSFSSHSNSYANCSVSDTNANIAVVQPQRMVTVHHRTRCLIT